MEDNTCPKPNCGRPESTQRWSRGKRLSICGSGHSWDAKEVAEQRAKAKEARVQESVATEFDAQTERFKRAVGSHPILPDLKSFG